MQYCHETALANAGHLLCRSANKRVMLVLVGVALLAMANSLLVPISMEAAVQVCACALCSSWVHSSRSLPSA